MTKHSPPASTANRREKRPGDKHEVASDTTHAKHLADRNTPEQAHRQHQAERYEKDYFRDRRMK
jgi:hypothetical protein